MADHKLDVEIRTDFGKGFARRARTAGKIPAVVYGHGADTQHLLVPAHQLFLIVKDSANAVISMEIDGKQQLALVKDIQRHPVRRDILHVDLLAVNKGEKVDVEVPIVVEGEAASGAVISQDAFTLAVKAPATNIPEHFVVDVTGLAEGTIIKVSDMKVPADCEVEVDAETVILSVMAAQVEETEAAEEASEEAETEE